MAKYPYTANALLVRGEGDSIKLEIAVSNGDNQQRGFFTYDITTSESMENIIALIDGSLINAARFDFSEEDIPVAIERVYDPFNPPLKFN